MVSLASPLGAMPPPPTPLERPPYGLKRDSSYLDADDEAGLSLSTKRLKVAFDPKVDVRIMDDWTDKSFDLVKEEVRLAIDRHNAPAERKDEVHYAKLLELFSHDPSSADALRPKLLKKYLLAVHARVNSLGDCGKLVMAILDQSWLGRDDVFVSLYTKFLCDTASAHSRFNAAIIDRLVSNLSRLPASYGRLPEEIPVPRSKMFGRLHTAIKALLRQTPSASSQLMRALKQAFPTDAATLRSYMLYQKNLFHLAKNIPELKAEIIALLVRRLVDIDVQIQQDIEDLEEESEDDLLRRPSSLNGEDPNFSDESESESKSESEITITAEEQRLREVRSKVAKMDETLELLFEYYTTSIEQSSEPDSSSAYQQLLSHFTTFILPTRSRHAQFLLFHFSQTSSARTDTFTKECLQLTLSDAGNPKHRLTACAYLSSFIARGTHVSTDYVQSTFLSLLHQLDILCRKHEPNMRGPDKRTYSTYYAIAQALLYIFCFRWRDLVVGSTTPEQDSSDFNEDDALAEGHDLVWLHGIKETMTANLYSRLNPLKVCSPGIVNEFAKIAHHLRFMYIFPKLEANKRFRLGQTMSFRAEKGGIDLGRRETAWERKTGEAHLQLEAYFPFDPYLLPKSKKWIDGDYNEWKLPSGMRRAEESLSEEDDDDDDDASEDESADEVDDLPQFSAAGIKA